MVPPLRVTERACQQRLLPTVLRVQGAATASACFPPLMYARMVCSSPNSCVCCWLPCTGCGHCQRLVPEYSKLGEKIASDPKLKNRVLIAKVGLINGKKGG